MLPFNLTVAMVFIGTLDLMKQRHQLQNAWHPGEAHTEANENFQNKLPNSYFITTGTSYPTLEGHVEQVHIQHILTLPEIQIPRTHLRTQQRTCLFSASQRAAGS